MPLDDTHCYLASNSQLVLKALETVAESEESDEEMRQWEEQQINKGVKIIQATQQLINNLLPTGNQNFGVGTGAYPYVVAQTQFSYQQYGDWQQQQLPIAIQLQANCLSSVH